MTDDPGSRSDGPDTAEYRYDKLDKFIQEYVKKVFEDQGLSEQGDYIASWALVVNYGNLDYAEGMAAGYLVESMPPKTPPHAIKGLLREGIDWVLEAQEGAFDDDEI